MTPDPAETLKLLPESTPVCVHLCCPQTKFQSDFSESFQCILSNRCFINQKKPKFSICTKIFLQSFLPFFRVSVKSFIHIFFLFLTKRTTVQNIKHVNVFLTGRRGLA